MQRPHLKLNGELMNYRLVLVLVSLGLLAVIGMGIRQVSSLFSGDSTVAPNASVDERPGTRTRAVQAAPALQSEWDSPVADPSASAAAGTTKPQRAPVSAKTNTATAKESAKTVPQDETDEELAAKFDPRKIHQSRKDRYQRRSTQPSQDGPAGGNR